MTCVAGLTALGIAPAGAQQPIELHPPYLEHGSSSITSNTRVPIAPRLPIPTETYALQAGHWQLMGANYVWVPPETILRRVETRELVGGHYAWRDGWWVWVPTHWAD